MILTLFLILNWVKDNMDIRELRLEDIDQVCVLEEEAFSMPWHKESFIDMVNNPDALYLVMADGDIIYGCAGLLSVVGEGEICNIVVDAKTRNQGVGYKLVDELLRRGREEYNIEAFTLEVRVGNGSARHLYEKLGFVCEGIRPNFYDKPNEDAAIYWLR